MQWGEGEWWRKEVFGLNAPCTHFSSGITSHLGVKSFTQRTRKFLESQGSGLQLRLAGLCLLLWPLCRWVPGFVPHRAVMEI